MDKWDEVFELLERPDKWFLGGGRVLLWAPLFPRHLDVPGFWDPGTYYHLKVGPLFTVTILAENGLALEPKLIARRWRVSHLVSTYELGVNLTMIEHRSLSPEDVLVTELEIKSATQSQRSLDIVAWTAQSARDNVPGADFITAVRPRRDGIVIARQVNDTRGTPVLAYCQSLGAIRDPDSLAVNLSESSECVSPRWELTPFSEKFNEKGLPRESVTRSAAGGGLRNLTVYAGMHYRLIIPPGTVRKFSVGTGIAKSGTEATRNLKRSLGVHSPADRATRTWRSFFQTVPYLRASDPYIERCYWYRWYGLRLNMVLPADYGPKYACVFEGTGAGRARHPTSGSGHFHMREMRWCHDKTVGQGTLLNFVEAQKGNGEFPGTIGVELGLRESRELEPAGWGRAVCDLFAVHPDRNFIRSLYEPLARHARCFIRSHDRSKSGLFDAVRGPEKTSEQTMRYRSWSAEPEGAGEVRLKGVDATVYMYDLFRALAWMARQCGKSRDASKWKQSAEKTLQASRAGLFDATTGMFCDTDAETGRRSPVKSATGFYPFLTDVAGPEHLGAIHGNLLNPMMFWTEFPSPSVSMDDPLFSATGEWQDVRVRGPWNGRAWLGISSEVAQALAQAALKFDRNLRVRASELLRNLIRETFIDRDPARPTSYEYYNPLTGQPPFFLGSDDHMHSRLVDLILSFVAGLRPDVDGNLVVDPFPFGLKKLSVDNVKIRGRDVSLEMIEGQGRLVVGGHAVRFIIGQPVTVDLAPKKSR
jgi:hypothetical protein